MTNPAPQPNGLPFPHRLAFAILITLLLLILLIQYWRRPLPLDLANLPQAPLTLPARIDPNTASLAELSRIPHLAETLAQKIIDYRQQQLSSGRSAPIFQSPGDLTRIGGLKQKTLERFLPYLEFPGGDEPTTIPGSLK